MAENIFEDHLDKNPANYQPLSPLSFLQRSAQVYPDHASVIHGQRSYTYAQTYNRCVKLASALSKRGLGIGDTVAILAPNIPEMLEAHYGVPMSGAVLNTINTRLDAATIAFILDHGEAKVVLIDREFAHVMANALRLCKVKPIVIDIDDSEYTGGELIGESDYEAFIAQGDADFAWALPQDEWQTISLNYTSGTTGNPKGVVYHHRGAYLLAMGNILTAAMPQHSRYLWTLPMFHCNGWCFTWSISIIAGTHICLRRVSANDIFSACATHNVTHMCGAPIVMNMMVNANKDEIKPLAGKATFFTAAAPPPAATLQAMEAAGFDVIHVYGLTETYGPAAINAWHDEWDELPADERAAIKSRQGVTYPVLQGLSVRNPETMEEVPRNGETIGEVMFQGNVVMKGYLKNRTATDESFAGGWFHSGDLGVWHKDGYIQLKDRSKDIIISGGENISSIEVENTLYMHPAVLEAAVVARPDDKWGETPCAFITIKQGVPTPDEKEIIEFCRNNLAHFKCPKTIIFTDLPKTSTGKVQKFKLREIADDL